jgi:hypothetical protein
VQSLYSWIVFVHVLAAFGFVLAHGATAIVAFRVRSEREPQRIAALLDLSTASMGLMYLCAMVLVVAGVVAGLMGHWFGQVWIWGAIAALVAVTLAMLAYATPYYLRVRVAVGQRGLSRAEVPPTPAPAAELAALLDSRRPEVIAVIGGVGLALIVWLMVFKPF